MNIKFVGGKSSIVILCSSAAVLTTVIAFILKNYRRKKNEDIVDEKIIQSKSVKVIEGTENQIVCEKKLSGKSNDILDNILPKEWKIIGEITELFIYPLKSGRGKNLKVSLFTDYGISTFSEDEGCFLLRDRMFMVYKEGTGELKTGKNYPTLVLVTLSVADKNDVKLEAVGMPFLKFRIPEKIESAIFIPCKLWWGENFECVDCGSEVARWISRFLTGTNSGLRLCCAIGKRKSSTRSEIAVDEIEPWQNFENFIKNFENEKFNTDITSNFASYSLMSESSINVLNENVNRPRSALQFRPNVVVSGPEPFSEYDWKWIKIVNAEDEEEVVLRNVKPYSKAQRDARRIQIAGELPTAGINCGIYKTGCVKVGNCVYVNVQQDQETQGSHKPASTSEIFLEQKNSPFTISSQYSVSNGLT